MNVIVWLSLCVIWGTTWFFIKIGLQDLPPISFATARFVCAGLILLLIVAAQKIPLPKTKQDWKLLAVTGLLQFSFNYGVVFWSEQYITSSLAAVLQATIPAFGLVMARVHLPQERITWHKAGAVLLGIAGVAIIFVEQLHVKDVMAFAGSVAIVAGAFAAAESNILVKSRAATMHPVGLLFGQMMCGLLPLALLAWFKEGNPANYQWTARALGAVLYLAVIGTVAAFWLYYWLLNRVESTKAMTIALVTPLVAVVIGSLALEEKLPLQTFIGGALILGSVSTIVLKKRPNTVRPDYQTVD